MLCQPVFLPPRDDSRAAPFEAEARLAVVPVYLAQPAPQEALAPAVLGEAQPEQAPVQPQADEPHLVVRRFLERLQGAMAALPQDYPPAPTALQRLARPGLAVPGRGESEERWRRASRPA